MNKIPAISVVMPVYNAEKYLKQSIESILNQTFADFELVMINDGSTDGSLKILESFAKLDSRCSVYSQENKGISETINNGIRLSRAEIICIMDNDDVSMPLRLEKQFQYLNDYPECVALGTNALLIDPDGLPINTWVYEQTHDEIDSSNLSGASGSRICHPSVALRKSAVLAVGGYRPEFQLTMDYDLFLRLAEVGKLANLPDVLFKYRQHLGSAGHEKRDQQLMETLKVLNETYTRRALIKNFSELQQQVNDYVPLNHRAQHLKWGWWALSEKNYQTSIKYALKATFQKPLNLEGLKLLACVVRSFVIKR
ncbi:MAG: glycosyltransferase [Pseudomonadota bacterium]